MAAPKDPNQKPITLDLDIKQEPEREKKAAETAQPQFKDLKATLIRPDQAPAKAPPKTIRLTPNRSRPGRTKAPASSMKPIFIMGGLLIAAFLLAQFIGDRRPSSHESLHAPPPKLTAKSARPVPTDTLPKPPPRDPPRTDPHQSIRAAGLSQLGTQIDAKGNASFAVRIKAQPVCYPGDVEAMRNVVGANGSLLLSLEPMSESGKAIAPVSRVIALKDIIEGTKVSLPVDLKQQGVYGIYICGDAANTRSCGHKKPADFNKILNFRDLDVAANAVFYYQFTVLGLDYATVYTGLEQDIGGTRDQLRTRKPDKDWQPQLDKAASMMRGVKSLPPKTLVEGNVVTLELQVAMVNPDGSCR